MEATKTGVFSPCANLDAASMIKCLQALLKKFPSIRFDSVITDSKCRGFKVYFSEPSDLMVLQSNELFLEGPVLIYPLTTYLMIANVDHKKTPLFERELSDAIKKNFGKVIHISKTSNHDRSENWLLEIDIPELKSLKAFEHFTFAQYQLPIPTRNEEVTLRQWCRQCKVPGHFQHECSDRSRGKKNEKPAMNNKETRLSSEKVEENFKDHVAPSADQSLGKAPKKFFNISLETTDRYAEKIGIEEVMSFSTDKPTENNTKTNTEENISSNLLTENNIKKEIFEFSSNNNTPKKMDINKRIERHEMLGNAGHSKSRQNEETSNKSEDFYSGDEEDIKIIEDSDTSTSHKSPSYASNSSRAEARHFDEDSRSSPDTKHASFPSFSSAIPRQTYELPPSQAAKPTRGAEVTTSLSERLQDCINLVCMSVGVLDRKQLDAFLIHVKKKSNPIRVALNYTPNTKGLKEQLQGILNMYYNTPQTGTKEDIQFIKWLNGLVERYDGSIPKKRKRSGKGDDDNPTKR